MGMIRVRYLIERSYKGKIRRYWSPKQSYVISGGRVKCPFRIARLSDDPTAAFREAESWNKRLDDWLQGIETAACAVEGTFDWLIVRYKASQGFKALGDRTRKEYGYILEAIRQLLKERKMSGIPAPEIDRQMARALHHAFAERPRKAQLVVALSRIVFNFGIETGMLKDNPFEKLRIKRSKPRALIWLDLDHADPLRRITAMRGKAIELGLPSVALAIDLSLWTTQREGDVLALPWSSYDGKHIAIRQRKTRAWVKVPVMPQLKASLDAAGREKASTLVLVSERTGKPYSKDHFGDLFREVRQKAGIGDTLQYRDLRKTSCVMLKLAGCTIPEIASWSGHAHAEVSEMMDVYLPPDDKTAENAFKKMKRVFGKS